MSAIVKLSFKQKREVARCLEEVCAADDDGFAVYDQELNDDLVAHDLTEQLGFYVNAPVIANLRRNLIGKFRPRELKARSTKALAIAEMVAAIEALETAASVHQATVTTIIETQDILREEIASLRAAVSIAGTEIKNIRRVGV